jgi:basic amino acid/polyamine antiporter, APA family
MPMAAGEVRDPGRNIPRALDSGHGDCAAGLWRVESGLLLRAAHGEIANSSSTLHGTALPVASKAAQTFLPRFGAQWVAIAAMLSTIGALNGSILTGARIPYAMARDGLFFACFGRLGERSAVPVVAIILQGVWAAMLVVSATFDQLTDCVIFAGMIFYAVHNNGRVRPAQKAARRAAPLQDTGLSGRADSFCRGGGLALDQHTAHQSRSNRPRAWG